MVKFSSEAGHPWAVLGVYGPVEPADRAGFYTTQLREAAEARPSGSSLLMAGDSTVSHHNWMCRLNKQIQLKIAD